ncbi:MAG: alanine--tRNA ligase [Bacteroidetes bacterium]|nr:alanine--tRNA ligase [Bacteroidota bacterium]
MLTSQEIRKKFLDFFEAKQHKIVASAPIVVKDDPTLMFTNAGMNQFKDLFLGNKKIQYNRIADTQKCLRVSGKHNDLEEVGVDTYHHTMFEMLGNWSFGDPARPEGGYFKKESINWSWELLTKEFNIPEDRIYVTVFEGDKSEGLEFDQEAFDVWKTCIDADRIINGNKKDNFWEMGDTGPCGPCSEIHVDLRTDDERKKTDGKLLVNAGDPQVIEVWNLVFIQFNRKADGTLEELPAKHVDTGMGFERLVRTLQNKSSNYDTDIFLPLIRKTEMLCGLEYGNNEKTDIAFRVIADHIRAVSFCIADGQLPSNTGAGYVIRRILRRAIRYGYSFLNLKKPFFHLLVPVLADEFANVFPELKAQEDLVSKVIMEEETSFLRTLETGMQKLQDASAQMLKNLQRQIPGNVAFELYDTYGFPLDLTVLIAKEFGFEVDTAGFEIAMQEQKNRSRNASVSEADDWTVLNNTKQIDFVGYDATEAEAHIVKMRKVKQKNAAQFQIVLDKTPFYAESGGQIGDTGILQINDKKIKVLDTKKENDLIIHITDKLPEHTDGIVHATIDVDRRNATANNHSATHLLHAAMRQVLGTHVQQKGSYVGPDRLRFDFSHFTRVTEEELLEIENIINKKVREDIRLDERRNVPIEEAKKLGAMMLFGEKYGEQVRVITYDENFSRELCGGIHVPSTGVIGYCKIISESAVAAGIRRIEAITGEAATQLIQQNFDTLKKLTELTKSHDAVKAMQSMMDENAALQKTIEKFRLQSVNGIKDELKKSLSTKNGIQFIATKVELDNADLIKKLVYDLRNETDNLFAVIGAEFDGKAHLTIMISENLVVAKNVNAATLVREWGKEIQGGGGGQNYFATAGGKNPNGLDKIFSLAKTLVENL